MLHSQQWCEEVILFNKGCSAVREFHFQSFLYFFVPVLIPCYSYPNNILHLSVGIIYDL